MAALSATAITQRAVIGDLVERTYTLAGNNGDTFVLADQSDVRAVFPIPTTAISIGYTLSGNTITFVTSGAWVAAVTVHSRVG